MGSRLTSCENPNDGPVEVTQRSKIIKQRFSSNNYTILLPIQEKLDYNITDFFVFGLQQTSSHQNWKLRLCKLESAT